MMHKSLSAPNLRACVQMSHSKAEKAATGKVLSCTRRTTLLGGSLVPKLAYNVTTASLREALLYFASEYREWPCDENELSYIVNACVEARVKMGLARDQAMYFVHLLLHTALSFYEMLLNDSVNTDTEILKMTLAYYTQVWDHVREKNACTAAASENFSKIRKAMVQDLEKIEKRQRG